ncbi:MAG: CAP domain-containing protein [Catenulispora sp.]|nr:CAP domain-containing protein [Catenulispora sp.]
MKLRNSVVLAVVSGLAITAPLALRAPRHEIALGPERTAPRDVEAAPHSDPTATRTDTSVSRDAARSPAATVVGPPSVSSSSSMSSPDQASAFEAQVVALTNAQRTAHGCPALRTDHRLQLAAVEHSVDMQARGYFAHDTPDGVSPWTRVKAQGYPDPSAENIAMGQSTPQAVVAAWMASPGHRADILNCASRAVGVGVRFGPGGPWWTQDFGRS